jgi:hypothetical protein
MVVRRGKAASACVQHRMVRAVVEGWFVCMGCGLVAVCPGCMDEVPGDVRFHFCAGHEYLQGVESFAHRTVWATEQSER